MSGETLGTARIDLTIDTTEYEVAIQRSKNAAHGLSAEAQQSFAKIDGNAKKVTTSVLRWAETLGKTAEEQKLLNAVMRGMPVDVAEEVVKVINQQRQATEAATRAAQRLAETQAFERQAAEAARLNQASEYVRFWTNSLEEADRAQAHLAAQTQFVTSLQQQANAIGKTRAQLLEMKAAELGVSEQAAPFITALKAQENALYGTTTKLNQYGLSAKQTELALRQVPAQLTDIFVSLQGGQAPLTVLLQQGGQLKDVFGGIRPAAQALGAQLAKLVTPYTLLAAAIGVTIGAFLKGEEESVGYAKALAQAGAVSGTTASQLQGMAVAISTGVTTQHEAAAALAEVTKRGKFLEEQLALVAGAAINWERATGEAVDKTVDKFQELAKDPVDAVAKLNAEQHFLTETVYAQIKALQEQGNTQAAATLAIQSYADAVNDRSREIEENLGSLQTAWRNLQVGAKAAWDAMLDVGREDTLTDKIRASSDRINALNDDGPFSFMQYSAEERAKQIKLERQNLQRLLKQERDETNKAVNEAALQQSNDYAIAQDRQITAHLSADQKRAKEIERSRKESDARAKAALLSGNKELSDTIRANQTQYEKVLNAEGKKKKGDGGLGNAQARAGLQDFKDALTIEQGAIQNSTKMLQAEYAAKLVTVENYYASQRKLIERDTKAQETALTGQIALLKDRNVTGKDAANVERELGQLEAQLAKVRADGATSLAILSIQEKEAIDQRNQAIAAYKRALDDSTQATKDAMRASSDRLLMSDQEFEQQQKLNDIYKKGADRLRELQEQLNTKKIDKTTFDAEVEANQEAVDAQVDAVQQGYERMKEAQADWQAGIHRGLENWKNEAANVNAQMEQITTRSFDRMTDALVEFATTGKLEWKHLLADILKEIVKFLAKQAVMQFVQMFANGMGGGGGSGGGDFGQGSGVTWAAKGDTFSGPGIAAYSNQVHNTPQPFMFAKGAGIFGEAGWEAVMPLTRGPDGNLGVRASAGGDSTVVNLSVNTVINSNGSSSTSSTSDTNAQDAALWRRVSERMRQVCNEELQRMMREGGQLWRVGVTQR